jgi:hypothetical protein
MPMDRSQDTRERQRLEALVRRLSDAELTRQMDDGWSVAAVLAHLAFCDRRAAVLVERWRRTGVGRSEAEADAINDARAQWLALPPRVAAEQAVEAARAINAALDAAPDLVEQIVRSWSPVNVSRAVHRGEHLDQIERALAR